MKKVLLALAGVATLGGVPALVAPAAAQHRVVHERVVVRDHGHYRGHTRRVCRTTYRHHHRVRTCRTVR